MSKHSSLIVLLPNMTPCFNQILLFSKQILGCLLPNWIEDQKHFTVY